MSLLLKNHEKIGENIIDKYIGTIVYLLVMFVYTYIHKASKNFIEDSQMVETTWKIDYLPTTYIFLFQCIFSFIYYIK